MNSIWGLEYTDFSSDGYIFRMVEIKKPFIYRFGTKVENTIGLNSKFIDQSRRDKVHKFVIRVVRENNLESLYYIDMPSIADIALKVQQHYYEDKPSKFVGGSPMRIFWFALK